MPEISRRGERTKVRACAEALLVSGLLLAGPIAAQAEGKVSEETIHIPGPLKGMKLGLRHAWKPGIPTGADRPVVLILPGAVVPVSGNPDYPIGGRSMMTALAESDLDVWALDYYGFGVSDRYPEMDQPADQHPPLGAAAESADQVDSAVAFLRREYHVDKIMLIGDSGGSIVAGVFAARSPELVSRLIFFGPVTPFSPGPSPQDALPAYDFFTPQVLWDQFTTTSQAAGPNVLDSSLYSAWAEAFLRTDPTSATRNPPSVRIPNGRQEDRAAIVGGRFNFDPTAIRAPTLIVIGEWDTITTFPGAEWLLKSLRQAPQRRLVVIGNASHTMQYEAERGQLYRVMADFLNERG